MRGSLIDNSDARLKYDVDLLKSNCINAIKKFKLKKFNRKYRDAKDATHIGYIADDLLKRSSNKKCTSLDAKQQKA